MHAWILSSSPGEYAWDEIETPAPGPDDVAVRPVASALNHMDLWVLRGKPRPHLPHISGCDVAGIVEAIAQGNLLNDPLELRPLPLAGVPGWHRQQDAAFYAQSDYFRPLREGRVYPAPLRQVVLNPL